MLNTWRWLGIPSLTEFFNDWYYGEGYPVYSLNYIQRGTDELVIRLSQTPLHESVDFFKIPVPFRIFSANQNDSIDIVLNHTQNGQEFEVNPGFLVGKIEIDPDYWLVSKTSEIVKSPVREMAGEVVVYPNPFGKVVTISVQENAIPFHVKLFSIEGRLLNQFEVSHSEYKIENLAQGIYILQVQTKNGVVKEKIIRQ